MIALKIWRDIEVVITGLTRNQFGSNPTGVRIPLSPPKRKKHLKWCFFRCDGEIQWDSNAVKKQHSALFLNGDRRILQNITYKRNRIFCKIQERIPLSPPKYKEQPLGCSFCVY